MPVLHSLLHTKRLERHGQMVTVPSDQPQYEIAHRLLAQAWGQQDSEALAFVVSGFRGDRPSKPRVVPTDATRKSLDTMRRRFDSSSATARTPSCRTTHSTPPSARECFTTST